MSNELPGTADGADPWAILWVCVKQQTDATGGVIAIQGDPGERRQQGGRRGKAVETTRSNISLVGIAEGDDRMSRETLLPSSSVYWARTSQLKKTEIPN